MNSDATFEWAMELCDQSVSTKLKNKQRLSKQINAQKILIEYEITCYFCTSR